MNSPYKIIAILSVYLIISMFCNKLMYAQSLLGYSSNYDGAVGIYLNPSSISNSKVKLDINLFTFGGHLQNNYYFLPKSTYKPLNPFHNGFADIAAYQGHSANNEHNYLYTKEQLHFPSIMYSDGKQAFAVHLSCRFEAETKNVPNDIIRCLYEGMFRGNTITQELNTTKHADKFHFAIGLWEELGGTYSRTLISDDHKYLAAGITANLLLGNSAYYYNNQKVDYYFDDSSSISIENIQGDFGGVMPSGIFNGFGLGFDLGATYCIGDSAENSGNNSGYYNYKYKIGAALLDVGGIRFGKGRTYSVNTYTDAINNVDNTLDDLQNLEDQIDGLESKNGLNFYLPTALSLQFDYNLNDQFYVGANFIQGIRFTGCQIRRPTILAVTPRYESKWFEVSLPLSVYDWRQMRIGFEMRIFCLVVGTEKVGWLFKFQDYTGMDGYVSLRFAIGKNIAKTTKPLFK